MDGTTFRALRLGGSHERATCRPCAEPVGATPWLLRCDFAEHWAMAEGPDGRYQARRTPLG
ncbi:hypothetical protein C3Y87_07335 [Carbonactinospora thermoautotrophica]|uniref:hypothetical protein n=1 Tax=Carbonactinospora thermoautotrophica TaxID=1469144 RepID=UPI00226E143D|nr:hypothetical protein [Carbonactinospora thermoautotrophica]MCX9191227.1 hypothetical protein [Carbonactinospora thermoautotrophica]